MGKDRYIIEIPKTDHDDAKKILRKMVKVTVEEIKI